MSKPSLRFSTSQCSKSLDFQLVISPDVCFNCLKEDCTHSCLIKEGTFFIQIILLAYFMDHLLKETFFRLMLFKLLFGIIRNYIINRDHDLNDPYDCLENDNCYDWDDDSLENMYQD